MAQNETITLKDGTLIKGYISKQDFTKGKAEISFSEITMNVKVSDILNEVSNKRDYDELSEAWKVWATENNKLINENGEKILRWRLLMVSLEWLFRWLHQKEKWIRHHTLMRINLAYSRNRICL